MRITKNPPNKESQEGHLRLVKKNAKDVKMEMKGILNEHRFDYATRR